MKLAPVVTTLVLLLLLIGCKRLYKEIKKDQSGVRIAAPLHQDDTRPAAVVFDLKLMPGQGNSADMQVYDCSYISRGKTARFRLQFSYGPQLKDSPKDFPMYPASGKFIAVPGSESSAILEDLKNALEAKNMPRNVKRTPEVSFDAVVLGLKQTQEPDGGFSSSPPGNWIAAKIFFAEGDDDAEVFLNLGPAGGKGEFSIKDADYGDDALRELAKVLYVYSLSCYVGCKRE